MTRRIGMVTEVAANRAARLALAGPSPTARGVAGYARAIVSRSHTSANEEIGDATYTNL
jgi:hypothetical protein